jgi:hypothetical protein
MVDDIKSGLEVEKDDVSDAAGFEEGVVSATLKPSP